MMSDTQLPMPRSQVRIAALDRRATAVPARIGRDDETGPGDNAVGPDGAEAQDVSPSLSSEVAADAALPAASVTLPEPASTDTSTTRQDSPDRSVALLASGLGLLGIGGAAALSGSSSAAVLPPIAIEQPKPRPDPGPGTPPKLEEKPTPPPEQPKPDETPKPDPNPPKPDEKPTPEPEHPKPDEKPTPDEKPEQPNPEPELPKPEDPRPEPPAERPAAPTLSRNADRSVSVGNLVDGASWQYSLDDGRTWHDGRTPTLGVDAFGADGQKTVLARQSSHGLTSETASLSFLLDTLAPVQPGLSLVQDTGASGSDHITSVGYVMVNGIESRAKWFISLDRGLSWSERSGNAVPESLFGEDGAKTLQVKQVDAEGNTSAVAQLSFQLDRTAPDALRWSMPASKPALGRADTIDVQGLEAGASLQYRRDEGDPWIVAANGSIPASMFDVDGVHSLQVRQTDLAGNVGPQTRLTANVDVTAPSMPTLVLISDTGASSIDRITFSSSVRVGGLEAGATLLVNVEGAWEAGSSVLEEPYKNYSDGRKTLQVKQVDAAGNASAAAELTFTLDREALVPNWLSSSKHQGESDVLLNAQDFFQVERHSSRLAAQDVLSYRIDGGTLREVPADGLLPLSVFGADGKHQLELFETDLAGNVGHRSIEVTLDKTPPSAPLLSLKNDDGVPGDKITSDPTVLVNGLQAGDVFKYRINGGDWMSGWEWRPGTGIKDVADLGHAGTNTVEVYLIDAAGNVGVSSQFTFQYAPGGAVM